MRAKVTPPVVRVETALLLVLAAMVVLGPTLAWGQYYCGPKTEVNFSGLNGQYPSPLLTIDSQGNVYGTTTQGGPSYNPTGSPPVPGYGTIWKFSPSGGLTTLFSFGSALSVNGVVLDSQGNLWGTTPSGGINCGAISGGCGTIFEVTPAGQFSTIHQFSGPDGAGPGPLVFDSQGNLWGATSSGGTPFNASQLQYGNGTLFEYNPSAGIFTNPLLFSPGGLSIKPSTRVVFDGQGNLYGVAGPGTNGFGSLFEFSSHGVLTTLVSFTGLNGEGPNGVLTLDSQGNLYGQTYQGGAGYIPPASGYGSIFKYSVPTGQLTTLYSFTQSGATGQLPLSGGATLDTNGNLYGTTTYGGTDSDGVVWEYSSSGALSDLVTFSGPNGSSPESTLVLDNASNLWGTTNQGGASGYGTLFELTPNTGSGCGPSLLSLTFNPASVPNGGSTTGTVTLNQAAPSGGSVVTLVSSYPDIQTPSTVTVPAGSTSTTFTASPEDFVNSNTSTYVTASLGDSTVEGALTQTPGVTVNSISFNPSTVTGGTSTTATVKLASNAPSGGNEVLVEFCANCNPADPNPPVQLPVTVTVQAGQNRLSFSIGTLCTNTSETVPIFAQSGGASVSSNLTVNPSSSCVPNVASVNLVSTVTGGNSLTGSVTLTANAPTGGAVVSLSSNNAAASVPASVTVAAGNTSASFTITTTSVSANTTAVITAKLGSSSQQASLTILPASGPTVSSASLNPTSVQGGSSSQGTVTLSAAAPSGGSVVSLSSNSSSASVPSSVTVPSGSTSASFTVTTTSVTTTTTATITATLGSSSQQATLTITTAGGTVTLSSLTLNPTSVSGGNNSTGTVTLSAAAPSGGVSVALSSNNTSVATVPSSVTVSAGQTSASFTVRTQRVSSNTNVVISATYAGTTKQATLTVTSGRNH